MLTGSAEAGETRGEGASDQCLAEIAAPGRSRDMNTRRRHFTSFGDMDKQDLHILSHGLSSYFAGLLVSKRTYVCMNSGCGKQEINAAGAALPRTGSTARSSRQFLEGQRMVGHCERESYVDTRVLDLGTSETNQSRQALHFAGNSIFFHSSYANLHSTEQHPLCERSLRNHHFTQPHPRS